MGDKTEAIEVNILSDDDVGKEKTNGIHHAPNGTRLESITDDHPISNGQLSEAIEVNILSDDDVGKEKTNGIHHAPNGTRLESITDDHPISNGQLSEKDQSVENKIFEKDHSVENISEKDQSIGTADEHENWGFYKQVKSLCFPVSSKKTERQQRIKKILVSINSIEANLNQLPDDNRIGCNKNLAENILLGLAILTVIAVFMVPVVLYYTAPPVPATDDSAANFFRTCISDCSTYAQTSGVCNFIATDNPDSVIPNHFANNQEEAEKKLLEISNITSQCSNSSVALSFFCKAGYRSCSNNSDLFPECVQLRNDTCREQWRDLQSVSPTVTCCNGYNHSACPDQFARFCDVCTPVCHEFSQYGKATLVALDVLRTISAIVGNILFGVLVFVAAYFKRKTMFHFPNVLVLYFTAVVSIYGIFALPPIFWSKDLLCSHDNLFIAITESTTFCQIQGFCLDAVFLMYTQFWLLFVFHLFMKIVDPLKTWIINKQEYARRIYIIEVVAVFFFALITPITTVAATDGYHIVNFPPRMCASEAKVFFHGILLPSITMCTIGICLILVTFFHVHRTTGIFKRTKKGIFTLSVPEVKLLIISFYLTIVLGVSIIQFTLNVRDLNDIYDSIVNYSQCVASGNCDCESKREIFEKASLPEITIVFYICVMFINASNLLFIIQLKDVKKMARRATKSFISTDTS